MASSSSSSAPRTWKYRVFTSFHGPDVRKTFLSHLRKQFSSNGISMFDDQEIERGETIAPALTQAIRESRISIVVLSKNYASSSWCLDELVEIFKCKENLGQIVMTVFYGIDPSDVRKQSGDFGSIFNETCTRKTKEERQQWSQALTEVGNIAGEHFLNWDNESKMIEKIARDVSNKLNTTISNDFEDMVGIEAHLQKLQASLQFNNEDGAMIVGIVGPAGIGKTTIARAFYSRFSSSFHLSCFMDNVSGRYNKGLDDHGLKLSLQEQLLSNILNQNGMRKYHLRAIQERLHDQKVLIILDDVDHLEQLEALAYETSWFGPGSKIIVTTRDQEVLEQHDINNKYHVDFPTKEDAREILCRKAFRQSLALNGYEKLVERVTELCGNLPLGLGVIGSTLRKKKQEYWEYILHRLENSLDPKIEGVLRVGYDNLHKDDQLLFLLIAIFFNYQDEDYLKAMVAGCNSLEVGLGFRLKTLAYRSLIQISMEGTIVMHKLLQQVGREVVQRQDQGKRPILIDNDEICHVLENDSGSGSVMGISLDMSTLSSDVYISSGAFKKTRNLRYLNIYTTCSNKDNRVHVVEEMNFVSKLRLLHWEEYPGKCLPHTFKPEYLVELNLQRNKLEKLWEGIQPLTNLKKMSLAHSIFLKELPDLSNATNLELLKLDYCLSLVRIPSSIGNLQKLERLEMEFCINLQVVPTHLNLASLENVFMFECYQLRDFPETFKNITRLTITDTMLQVFSESIRLLTLLRFLNIFRTQIESLSLYINDTKFPDWIKDQRNKRPPNNKDVYLDIEKLPEWIKDLHCLEHLGIFNSPKLASLPEFPASLKRVFVLNCESLETLMPFSSESAIEGLYFTNCFKLGEKARRIITQRSRSAWLPGRNLPAQFDQRAIGNSLTIPLGTKKCRFFVVVSPKQETKGYENLSWRLSCDGFNSEKTVLLPTSLKFEMEHLYIGYFELQDELESDALLEFSTTSKELDITECGLQTLADKTNRRLKWIERLLSHHDIIMDETSSSYGSISEQMSENEDGSVSDGNDEFGEPKVKCLTSRAFEQRRDILKNVTELSITDAMLEDLLECVSLLSHLLELCIYGSSSGRPLPEETWLIRSPDIEKISDSFKDLHGLQELGINGCPKLASLPELPPSLTSLFVFDCDSLETLMPFSPESKIKYLYFSNCLKLGEEARRVITQQSTDACLVPGRNVPAEFEHRATGNSLTISSGTGTEFRVFLVLSPKQGMEEYADLLLRQSCNGFTSNYKIPNIHTEHLFINRFTLPNKSKSELLMEFSTTSKDLDVIECGFQILTEKTNRRLHWKERPLWHQDIIMDETTSRYDVIGKTYEL